ncbi:MAG: Asp-tRNA(Asn)/Glu-tRNA(Gln) amidotransferase GatCAB subunit B [Candidatus Melainabacteria bacterium HGW-Melainabacteria-1]|nr:MAG: Asp-tRNA(Asn)/Glu-tRNA(Gln) amidotransferase GatCAB subunit B [Candidatus Melainabacteria bacterium HGW-Melainabacteria-1]
MTQYESVIGLEVHAELLTQSKLFCESAAHFGGEPNSHVGPVSLGLPGSLPVLNRQVLEMAVKAGLATNCQIARQTKFDRKHYFYPDLPKGYQITQYDQPIAESGWLDIRIGEDARHIRLNRIHMEEDAGKLVHAGAERMSGSRYSLVDYNRAGVPLLEIVSEPDLRTSEEARAYLEELRGILIAIGVCDGKMQEGSLRCDANVSVRPVGSDILGTRVEIKNINSFRFLQKAIDYEIERQIAAVEAGEPLVQETRLWDEQRNRTISMRSKEEAHDYRYFPDPDLVDFQLDPSWVEQIQTHLPELPSARRQRYQQDLNLSAAEAAQLVTEAELCSFFEAMLSAGASPREASKWLLADVAGYLNDKNQRLSDTHLSPQKLAELLDFVAQGTLSHKMAKDVLIPLLESDQHAEAVIQSRGLQQISDHSAIEAIITEILQANPEQVEQFKAGKDKVVGFLMGQVMKQTRGQAEPGLARDLLHTALARLRHQS